MRDSYVDIMELTEFFPTSLTTHKAIELKYSQLCPSGHIGKKFVISQNHVSQCHKMAAQDQVI